MKKIVIFSLLLLILNSCASDNPNRKTTIIPGVGKVNQEFVKDKTTGFMSYLSKTHPYKVFAENPLNEKYWGAGYSYKSFDEAIKVALSGNACSKKGL